MEAIINRIFNQFINSGFGTCDKIHQTKSPNHENNKEEKRNHYSRTCDKQWENETNAAKSSTKRAFTTTAYRQRPTHRIRQRVHIPWLIHGIHRQRRQCPNSTSLVGHRQT